MQFFGHFRSEFKDDVKMYKWEKRKFLMNDLVFWSPFPIFRLDMRGRTLVLPKVVMWQNLLMPRGSLLMPMGEV